MPRMARVVLPHMPHHVVQRGHNRQVVFAGAEDYERYLEDLRELSSALEIRVYAYCLMTNHVHLLLGPGEEVAAMGRLMKALAARATRYRNRLGERDGTLCLGAARQTRDWDDYFRGPFWRGLRGRARSHRGQDSL